VTTIDLAPPVVDLGRLRARVDRYHARAAQWPTNLIALRRCLPEYLADARLVDGRVWLGSLDAVVEQRLAGETDQAALNAYRAVAREATWGPVGSQTV
jgi:hypothetical protein